MTDFADIKRVARTTIDEKGEPVVQIPLALWEEFVGVNRESQKDQIEALLDQWENEADDDMSASWWDDFMQFLKTNRVSFDEHNLDHDDK